VVPTHQYQQQKDQSLRSLGKKVAASLYPSTLVIPTLLDALAQHGLKVRQHDRLDDKDRFKRIQQRAAERFPKLWLELVPDWIVFRVSPLVVFGCVCVPSVRLS
jgi:hypothetical protein